MITINMITTNLGNEAELKILRIKMAKRVKILYNSQIY